MSATPIPLRRDPSHGYVGGVAAGFAARLGIDRVFPDQRIWLGDQWFNVAGILQPSPLAPDIDNSALVG